MQLTIFFLLFWSLRTNGDMWQRSDKERTDCLCVPHNMCLDNDVDINEGEGLLDIRLGRKDCHNYNEVCCQKPLVLDLKLPMTRKCGFHSPIMLNHRITSDSQMAQFGEVPWTMAVLMAEMVPGKGKVILYKCGGSLIHPQVVMTAAHCVADSRDAVWLIRAGEWNTTSRDEPLPHQQRTVQKILVHPLFHSRTLKNDAALLIFSEPVQLADNVGVICLPPAGLQLDGIKCVASGWGKDSFKEGKHSRVLKMIELPLVNHFECQRSLRKTRLGNFYHLDGSFLCAGGERNKDTCKGDGGSPLVCPVPGQPGRYLQMGIVAWGIGCGEYNTPGVYVNVPEMRNWVDEQLMDLTFDVGVYNYE